MPDYVKNSLILLSGILAIVIVSVSCADPQVEYEELRAIDFLRFMNAELKELTKKSRLASFTYDTNMTKVNKRAMISVTTEVSKRRKELLKDISQFNWPTYKDPNIKRQFLLSTNLGTQALSDTKYKKWWKLISDMQEIQTTTTICAVRKPNKCEIAVNPAIPNIYTKYDTTKTALELQDAYLEYVTSIGCKVKPLYKEYVELMNEAAKINGFSDAGEEWIAEYEDINFKKHIAELYKEIKPLYTLLHAYIRHKLKDKYGDVVSKNGPIPVHLTGVLYGDSFQELYNLVKPYPEAVQVDYDLEVTLQNYTAEKMFETAEEFYVSMNMTPLPELFWNNSIFENNSEISCNAMTYDMGPDDPRIKICTDLTLEGLHTAHKELGQIEYFLQFADLPQVYRNAPNEAIYEAVGGAIGISFRSLKHLKKLKFWKSSLTNEVYLNNAFRIALNSLPVMTFAYAAELWRWGVFSGNITEDDYNCPWWKIVEEFQGLEPPVVRSSDDFDVAAKFNIVANFPYIKYFNGIILEYQFYKAMCLKADKYVPNVPGKELHKCDFFGSAEAGNALKAMLKLGSSKQWPDALEVLTGQRNIGTGAILEYFKPVQLWLENEIERLNIPVGWTKSPKVCHVNTTTTDKI